MDEGFNRWTCWSPISCMCSWRLQKLYEDYGACVKNQGELPWQDQEGVKMDEGLFLFYVRTIALNKEGKAMHFIMCSIDTQKPLMRYTCLIAW